MKHGGLRGALVLLFSVCSFVFAHAIGGDGLYFVQTFEDPTQYPDVKSDTEQAFTVEGQGEWLYLNAFQATNQSYIPDGSAMNLRMPKSGSYVVTPVLPNGVSRVTFDIGRASVKVYTSEDGGAMWEAASQTTTGKKVTVQVGSDAVNRIKVANETSKDADIDNLAVYAQTFDTPVVLLTGAASDITGTSARLSGTLSKNEGEDIAEVGFVWSAISKEPTLADQVAPAAAVAEQFAVTLDGLREGATVYYRAYAKYGDTQAYGSVKSFKTLVAEGEQTVDSEGRYFVQDFEDASTFPQSAGAQDAEFYVAGQGTWIYTNCYQSTNSSYNVDGSTMNLRMPKNGSYVITPILNSGVKRIAYYGPRKGDKLTCYVSKDGGSSWTQVAQVSTGNNSYAVDLADLNVNRIKLANDGSGDADIDNLTVYAQAFGTPATVATGAATNITKNSAEVGGQILDGGDQPITASGIIWSLNAQPSLADNIVETEDPTSTDFSLLITGLKANQTVYYRAYALSNAGYAYGDVQSFQTAAATAAVVVTSDVSKSGSRFRIGGMVTDDGGLDLQEVGVVYGTMPGLDLDRGTRVAMDKPQYKFSTQVSLAQGTTYYVRAYAITAFGTAFGDEKAVTTESVPEQPDEIKGDVIWCAPDGNDAIADGSEERPFFDVQKAIDMAQPGDRIWMKAGTYVYDKRINIDDHNGEPDKYIELFAKGGRAVLDFSGMPYHKHSDNPYQGVRLTSSYWHFYKIDICNASDNGMLIERNKPTGGTAADIIARTQDGHDNIIEQCNFYRNGDTGLQMKNLGAYNYVINCDAYENADESDGDADGFAPKISVGEGNYFFGCRAWNNSDDGYDVFFKKDGGFEDNKTIIMEYCLAYENGIMNGQATSGNGNGFKMGSNQGRMNVVLNRCLAVRNLNKGFDQNHNSGDIIMNNCTGIGQTDIGGKSYSYRIYEDLATGSVCELRNCVAINDRLATDKAESDGGKRGTWGRFEVTVASLEQTNDWKCAPENFLNMAAHEEIIGERQADGTLPEILYAHIDETKGAALIDAGTLVEANAEKYAAANLTIPAIEYAGLAPDLGAYETDFALNDAAMPVEPTALDDDDDVPVAIQTATAASGSENGLVLRQTRDGLLLITVKDTTAKHLTATFHDATGRLIGQHAFNAMTTAVRLPAALHGALIVKVQTDNGLQVTGKTMLR